MMRRKRSRRVLGSIARMAVACVLAIGGVQPAAADPVVVELFTSQGCSSCPPADAYLGELAARSDVLPLALHVNYWDYLGWKDSFGSSAYTTRQRAYAAAGARRTVFTPEVLVGGSVSLVGHDRRGIEAAISKALAAGPGARLEIARQGGQLIVEVAPAGRPQPESTVVLFRYLPEATVDIQRGENAGRRLTYHNVVRKIVALGTWDGRHRERYSYADEGEGRAAVIVQQGRFGPILAAAASD